MTKGNGRGAGGEGYKIMTEGNFTPLCGANFISVFINILYTVVEKYVPLSLGEREGIRG